MTTATETPLADAVARGAAVLRAAGLPSPRHDAERLAAHAISVGWQGLWSRLRDPVRSGAIDTLIARRAAGEPLAYILGSTVFFGIELEVGPGVLVPRPETECVVDTALRLAPRNGAAIADAGTGSGAIAIALATHVPGARVWASDISSDALAYASRNVVRSGFDIRLVHGDLLRPVPRGLDLVVSNPPYIPDDAVVPSDVGAEPHVALFGGPTGDEVAVKLIAQAEEWLRPGGHLVIEVGTPQQAERLLECLRTWRNAGTAPDHNGRTRVVWARS